MSWLSFRASAAIASPEGARNLAFGSGLPQERDPSALELPWNWPWYDSALSS